MRIVPVLLVVAGLVSTGHGSTIKITITGSVSNIHISEGPVFGYRSRQHIPDDISFILTYVFDDERGETKVRTANDGGVLESGQSGISSRSPGIEAVLQIGNSGWDFGESVDSEVDLATGKDAKSYSFRFFTANRENWITSTIYLAATNLKQIGDWRQSFAATVIASSTCQFSVDNGTVSATGSLTPKQMTVEGVELYGQALSFNTVAGGKNASLWVRQWRLVKPSAMGGCVVESVTVTVTGTTPPNGAPITPYSTTYLKAWRIAPGTMIAIPPTDEFMNTYPRGSSGTMVIFATARFYEGVSIPPDLMNNTALSRQSDVSALPTNRATLPITVTTTIQF